MPEKLTTEDLQRAGDAILRATSAEDFERAIENEPVLSSPIFHRELKRAVGQLRTDSDDHVRRRAAALEFFSIFHRRLHRRCLEEHRPRDVGTPTPSQRGISPNIPEYLRVLLKRTDWDVPPATERPYAPGRDDAAI